MNFIFKRLVFNKLLKFDKILLVFVGVIILVSLYIYVCTCSLRNPELMEVFKPFYFIISTLDYIGFLIVFFGLVFRYERVLQYQLWFGVILLICILIISLLGFMPNLISSNYIGSIKYSLLSPSFSIISWINLFWFSVIGLMNIILPTYLREI